MPPKAKPAPKSIETLTHTEATRPNIPTAELSAVARERDIDGAATSAPVSGGVRK